MVTEPKYYYHDEKRDLYIVTKTIKGKPVFFCSFKSEKAAKLAVELFKKTGWHKEDSWAIRAEVHEKIGDYECKQN